jgi:phosphoribosylglycinamide formyltransferase 2
MKDSMALKKVVYSEKPHFIVPEIEAIHTDTLLELENEGYNIVPCAKAVQYTMNRIGIRKLAFEKVGLLTSRFAFASHKENYLDQIKEIGFPAVVKPVMSSSGKGQSTVKNSEDALKAWEYAMANTRGIGSEVIIEEFIDFDYEITLLTIRTRKQGTLFCDPIGHIQIDGDYHESWQPQPMSHKALETSREYARKITDALGGYGLFGCELFIKGDKVWFSEISPRPHDTGMVTMVTQNITEFELHLRAILDLPIDIKLLGPGASYCFHAHEKGFSPTITGLENALQIPDTKVRVFGKPTTRPNRRMGVALALGKDLQEARERAKKAALCMQVNTE